MGGDKGRKGEKGFQEQLYRIHGQNQGGVESGEGGGYGLVGGSGGRVNADNCT